MELDWERHPVALRCISMKWLPGLGANLGALLITNDLALIMDRFIADCLTNPTLIASSLREEGSDSTPPGSFSPVGCWPLEDNLPMPQLGAISRFVEIAARDEIEPGPTIWPSSVLAF
jgi:hypothetical protein